MINESRVFTCHISEPTLEEMMPGGDTLSSTDPWLLTLTSDDDDGHPGTDGHTLHDTEPQEHGHGKY